MRIINWRHRADLYRQVPVVGPSPNSHHQVPRDWPAVERPLRFSSSEARRPSSSAAWSRPRAEPEEIASMRG